MMDPNISDLLWEVINCEDDVNVQNFINGSFVESDSIDSIDSFNPATGDVWAKIPDSNEEDMNKAVAAARDAFDSWSITSAEYRSKLLLKLADIIEANLEAFAAIESRDQGKPEKLATSIDIPRCVLNFRFFASTILHNTNLCREQKEPCHALNYVYRSAVGVCGLISPWNLPLYLLSFKLAPALACGNTVVAKPSEFTSVTAWLLAHAIKQAVGEYLVNHPLVPVISFTGSTATGTHIAQRAAFMHKKLSLEMGGKNACIVFKDVDLQNCIPTIVRSCFANQGEICLCSSRIFVHKTIFDDFVSKFIGATKKLKVGDPSCEKTDLGPLVSAQHLEKVQHFFNSAHKQNGHIICGMDNIELNDKLKKGYFFQPTVVTSMDDTSPLMQEEIFGPLVCISPFENEEEVVARANNVKYGLSASLWSNDVGTVHRVAQKLKVGTVWCNCWLVRELNMPFGGCKASGLGREGAHDSIEFFTEKKNICIKI